MKTTAPRIILRILVIIIAIVVLLAAFYAILLTEAEHTAVESYEGTTNPLITEYGEFTVSAHRSGGEIYPENTLRAMESCIRDIPELDYFEIDVQLTSDGELILLHDDTLDRTTNACEAFGTDDNKVYDHTYAELYELNFGESYTAEDGSLPYAGLRGSDIPEDLRALRLADALDYTEANAPEGHSYYYIIEIKDSDDIGRAATDELFRILEERDLVDRTIVATFNGEITEYFDSNYPESIRSASVSEVAQFYFDSLLGITHEYKFQILQIPTSYVGGIINLATPKLINHAHKNNIAVQYWTINDENTMKQLISAGADSITTDDPVLAFSLREEKNQEG